MRRLLVLGMALLAIAMLAIPAAAQDKPIQLALVTPVLIFPENYTITGVRLSLIYGKNASVSGFDWGLVTHTTRGNSMGIDWGGVNLSDANFTGWQAGFVNMVKGNFEGLQWGFFNQANYVHGLQLGFVNNTVTMKGLQIGIINIIKQGGRFPVFPIVNWSF